MRRCRAHPPYPLRSIAVDLPIPWPSGACITQLPEMRAAFTALVRRAYAAASDADALPPEYASQQQELSGLMRVMNGEFGRLMKFYAMRQVALSPTESVDRAVLTQLTYAGLTLELTTVDYARMDEPCAAAEGGSEGGGLDRRVWSTSVLFPRSCGTAEQVEGELIDMFYAAG